MNPISKWHDLVVLFPDADFFIDDMFIKCGWDLSVTHDRERAMTAFVLKNDCSDLEIQQLR